MCCVYFGKSGAWPACSQVEAIPCTLDLGCSPWAKHGLWQMRPQGLVQCLAVCYYSKRCRNTAHVEGTPHGHVVHRPSRITGCALARAAWSSPGAPVQAPVQASPRPIAHTATRVSIRPQMPGRAPNRQPQRVLVSTVLVIITKASTGMLQRHLSTHGQPAGGIAARAYRTQSYTPPYWHTGTPACRLPAAMTPGTNPYLHAAECGPLTLIQILGPSCKLPSIQHCLLNILDRASWPCSYRTARGQIGSRRPAKAPSSELDNRSSGPIAPCSLHDKLSRLPFPAQDNRTQLPRKLGAWGHVQQAHWPLSH